MKKLAMLASVAFAAAGLSLTAGCETPGYSTDERFQRIGRNWGYEYEQINSDVDDIFLLDPPTRLSKWNIQ
jgi:hypothetical protein